MRALLLVALLRVLLWTLPFRTVLYLARSVAHPKANLRFDKQVTPEFAAKAVGRAAGRLLRDKPCLTQAIALLVIYRRRSYPGILRIGVAKNGSGKLDAHAWIESGDRIAIGNLSTLSRFTPLPDVETLAF